MDSSQCTHMGENFGISCNYEDTRHLGLWPTLLTSFNLDFLLQGSIFKYSHIGIRLQFMNWRKGHQSEPNWFLQLLTPPKSPLPTRQKLRDMIKIRSLKSWLWEKSSASLRASKPFLDAHELLGKQMLHPGISLLCFYFCVIRTSTPMNSTRHHLLSHDKIMTSAHTAMFSGFFMAHLSAECRVILIRQWKTKTQK